MLANEKHRRDGIAQDLENEMQIMITMMGDGGGNIGLVHALRLTHRTTVGVPVLVRKQPLLKSVRTSFVGRTLGGVAVH